MWENFATYLGTQIFAGWTTPKSHLVQHLLSEGGQHQMLQEKVQEHLNRLCFHKWGKHLLNFQLFLLLLYVDLFSFYSTKIKQRCLFQTLDIIAQSTKCFLPVIHWVTITNPKNLTPTPAFSNSSAYFQQRSPQSGKWYGNDHSPLATQQSRHMEISPVVLNEVQDFSSSSTLTPPSPHRGDTQEVWARLDPVGGVLIGTGWFTDTALTDTGQAVTHPCAVSTEKYWHFPSLKSSVIDSCG